MDALGQNDIHGVDMDADHFELGLVWNAQLGDEVLQRFGQLA